MAKKFIVADLRALEKQVALGEITYSKMVEIINERFTDDSDPKEKELENNLKTINFWKRLEMFVSQVQVNDMPGEEEKSMILSVCKESIQ